MSKTELIKELRNLTQAGMKDCKEALEESNFDLQKAIDVIKVRGLNIVSKLQGRTASEGVIIVSQGGPCNLSALVEINCQTDFVANSNEFKAFANIVADSLDSVTKLGHPFTADLVEPERVELVAKTKENIIVRRWWVEEALDSKARVFTYVHSNNKIGVLLTLLAATEQAAQSPEFTELGNDLVMQVAAMNPVAVSSDRLETEVVARQKAIFETQLTEANKPQAAWPKILDGKFNKWYTDVCLLDQESVVVPKTTIKQVIKNLEPTFGEVQVVNFVRGEVGV